jgi:hypothetical protein
MVFFLAWLERKFEKACPPSTENNVSKLSASLLMLAEILLKLFVSLL